MLTENKRVLTAEDFKFPYAAYPTQVKLMRAIYSALDTGSIGLFESPTGTGKSLSIICATLKWLEDNRDRVLTKGDSNEPAWVAEQSAKIKQREVKSVKEKRQDIWKKRVYNTKHGIGRKGRRVVKRKKGSSKTAFLSGDEGFLVEDSHGKFGSFGSVEESDPDSDDDCSAYARDPAIDVKESPARMQILYATRTHSQLSQFLAEIAKTSYAQSKEHPLSVVTFGGRQHMCVNDDVKRLSSSAAITDRCLELQKKKSGAMKRTVSGVAKMSTSGCPYREPEAEAILRDVALTQLLDLEDITAQGEKLEACPYYGVRAALTSGSIDMILLPYSALLHSPTRESLNLKIDDRTIIVFDEAHNLVDTVSSLHAAQFSMYQLDITRAALTAYRTRYETRLSPGNRYAISQADVLLKGLRRLLIQNSKNGYFNSAEKGPFARVVLPSTIVFESKIDNVNLFQLIAWLKDSRLMYKLNGFIEAGLASQHLIEKERRDPEAEKHLYAEAKHALSAFENFVTSLTHAGASGRVNVHTVPGKDRKLSYFKYFLLDPSEAFAACCKDAKSILLLGGTLSPRDVLKSSLLRSIPKSKPVLEVECDHVVPRGNLKTIIATSGPTKIPLEFSFKNRSRPEVLDELGRVIANVATISPEGMVIFFPSYTYEEQVFRRLRTTGVMKALSRKKPIFRELRGEDRAFIAFRSAIQNNGKQGAILSAVLGGKLSEGINFADGFGRNVLVVGMPFANCNDDVEIQAKIEGMTARQQGEWLENGCMKSVNQGIGRVIRHATDWASIILCDSRFARERTKQKLPTFVAETTCTASSFGNLIGSLTRFYRSMGLKNKTALKVS